MEADDAGQSDQVKVSVVIPTIGRPELRLAVESVLAQSQHVEEVIVAADTDDILDLPEDSRIRIIRTGPRAGGNVARMAGIRLASAPLVALLDDDDTWVEDKLERQVAALRHHVLARQTWLCTSLVEESTGRIWPERLIEEDESILVYLFRKTRLRGGQGALHTSTMLFPRELALDHPFDESLRFHQDTDWLTRLDHELPGLPVVQVPHPLVRLARGEGSVSRGIQPLRSLEWARRAMSHADRRARGDFLLTVTYFQALRHRDLRAAMRIIGASLSWGRPTLYAIASIGYLPLKLLFARGRI